MEKRKISVGFIKPEKLEGNTIYVQITKVNGSTLAEAISAENFNCFEYSGEYELLPKIAKETSNKNEGLGSPVKNYHDFIEMLKTENTGICEKRYEADGLKLKEKLTDIIKGTNKVGKSLLDLPGKLNLDNF